jgi:hypothetical protein
MPNTNPEYDQEGMGRNIHSYCFNDGRNKNLTDDEMPNMRQVIEGGPSTAECTAAEAAHSQAACDPCTDHMADMAIGREPYSPRPYQYMPRAGEGDQPPVLVVHLCTDRPLPAEAYGRNAN